MANSSYPLTILCLPIAHDWPCNEFHSFRIAVGGITKPWCVDDGRMVGAVNSATIASSEDRVEVGVGGSSPKFSGSDIVMLGNASCLNACAPAKEMSIV